MVTETEPKPIDFADRAIESMKTPAGEAPPPKNTEAKIPDPVPTKTTEREVPAELFGGKKVEQQAETTTEPESEISKIADPEFKDPKRRADWQTLKTKAAEFEKKSIASEKQVAEMEKRIADAETKGKDSESLQSKLAELERQNAANMELVRKVNAELDPAFQDRFVRGRSKLVEEIKSYVRDAGGNPDDIGLALNLQGSERVKSIAATIGELPVFTQGILGGMIKELTALDSEAQTHRSNPETYLKEREQQDRERMANGEKEHVREVNLAFDSTLNRLGSELEVLRPVEKLEWWNQQREDIIKQARADYDANTRPGAKPQWDKVSEAFVAKQALAVYRQLFIDQREQHASITKERDALKKELEGLYGKSPTLRGGSAAASPNSGAYQDFATRTTNAINGR